MDICDEHGDDIAFSGRYCSACSQIDDIKTDHSAELNDQMDDYDSQLADMRLEIDNLQDKIDELENK